VPTFRSSCYVSAPTYHELRKVMGTGKFMTLVPLFHLTFLDRIRRSWCRNVKWAALARFQFLTRADQGRALSRPAWRKLALSDDF
jgi:hypothetical protein